MHDGEQLRQTLVRLNRSVYELAAYFRNEVTREEADGWLLMQRFSVPLWNVIKKGLSRLENGPTGIRLYYEIGESANNADAQWGWCRDPRHTGPHRISNTSCHIPQERWVLLPGNLETARREMQRLKRIETERKEP
jgi:hypothetical protein